MFNFAWFKTPLILQKIFPSFQWRIESNEKVIYLTFDDGPIPNLTEDILQVLNEYQAKATFFCVGENVDKHPEIFAKIIQNGHSIGNHTYHHMKAWKNSQSDYLLDLKACENSIQKSLPEFKKIFRPPYGQVKFGLIKKIQQLGYEIVMWDVLSKDYDNSLNSQQIFKNIIKSTEPGSIIVFHDNIKAKSKVLELLPLYLKHFSDIGFKFKSI